MTLKTNKSSPDPINILGFEEVGWNLCSSQPRPQLRAVVVRDSLLEVVDPGPEKKIQKNISNVKMFLLYTQNICTRLVVGEKI